ncbi:Aste57867_8499 [Aphanomyces stellatus]|uniref:Aste57867_8499 protein n=1 Tax=Aphanomyces stellatus TaxID=120398 RepID=A0A485KKE2_9STRA|nr:hypothetical protein As57867_008467 [Aphanomyces stellatus]VFT85385.1 Aste57867_8499 [Aphanomyces stellatus]
MEMPRTRRQGRRLTHPLPANFFTCPSYTDGQSDAMIQTGIHALKKLLVNSRLDGGMIPWKLDQATRDLQIYVGSTKGDRTVFMSVTELHATLDEAAGLHRAETRDTYAAFVRRYNKDVIDSALLATLASPTNEFPHNYIGLKWFVQETPMPCRNRDFSVIECSDDFALNGVRGWARVLHSIDLGNVPSLYSAMGIVRGQFHNCGTVFTETSTPGVLRAAQFFDVDMRGNFPRWLLRIGMKRRARTLLDMEAHFRAQRMTNMVIVSQDGRGAPRRKCFVCRAAFAEMDERRNCRSCGEVICRHCSRHWEIPDEHDARLRSLCLCAVCSERASFMEADAYPQRQKGLHRHNSARSEMMAREHRPYHRQASAPHGLRRVSTPSMMQPQTPLQQRMRPLSTSGMSSISSVAVMDPWDDRISLKYRSADSSTAPVTTSYRYEGAAPSADEQPIPKRYPTGPSRVSC